MKIISLGAGVQSTALLLMSIKGEIERADCAIFADTGWEPESVYAHLNRLMAYGREHDFPIHVVQNSNKRSVGNIKVDHIRAVKGDVSRVSQMPLYSDAGTKGNSPLMRACTEDYKIAPIQKKIRGLLGLQPRQRVKKGTHVESWFGITVDEMQRMRINQHKWITNKYPLIDLRLDRLNCEKWLEREGWGTVPKSACVACPYHNDRMWRKIKDEDPVSWNEAIAFDEEIRSHKKLPGVRGNVFVHGSRIPLKEVDLSTPEDHGQMSFLDECEGMCGV
jgi:hypothetical protein